MGKWFKETGGGAKTIANLGNHTMYKGTMYEWSMWIYMMDKDAYHLLSFSTGAKHPNCFIAAESGFSDGNGDDDEAPTPTRCRINYEIVARERYESRQAFQSLVTMAEKLVESRSRSIAARPIDICFGRLSELQANQLLVANDKDFSSKEQQILLAALVKEKKEIVRLRRLVV